MKVSVSSLRNKSLLVAELYLNKTLQLVPLSVARAYQLVNIQFNNDVVAAKVTFQSGK
jgi:hypothetical protein